MLISSPGPNEWACLNASGKPHYSAEGIFEWVSVVIRRGKKLCLTCDSVFHVCQAARKHPVFPNIPMHWLWPHLDAWHRTCQALQLFCLQAVEISQIHQAPYHTVGLRDRHSSSTMGSKFRVQASPPTVFLTKVADVSQEVQLLDPLFFGLSSAIYMRVRLACLSVEIPIFWGNCCWRFG